MDEATSYERDLYSWAVEQAALLRAGKIAEVDALNIAEEIDDVGSRQYDKLAAAVELDCDEDSFALKCPYSWAAILDRAVHWPPKD